MTRRFWIGSALTLPVFALEMGGHLTGLHQLARAAEIQLDPARARDTGRAVGRVAVLRARGWASLKTMNLNMFTLIAMGTGVAWIYSVVGTIWPGLFPASMRGHDGSVAIYFEAAAVITVLVLLGQVLEFARPRADERRHQGPARPLAEDGAAHQVRRPGRGREPR